MLDNLERSKTSLENDDKLKNTDTLKKVLEHLEIINKDMLSIFKKNNIEPIKSINEKLDPNLGPSNDGGYWLIAFSEKILSSHLHLPFINIKWSSENVLQNTIDNFSSIDIKYKFLKTKIDVDTINDIEKRN